MEKDTKELRCEQAQILVTINIPIGMGDEDVKNLLTKPLMLCTGPTLHDSMALIKHSVVLEPNHVLHTINAASEAIFQANKKQGFWGAEDADPKTSRNFGEMLMLVTSELGEAMEAHRKDKFASWDAYNSIIKATPDDATEAEALLLKRQAFKTYIKDSAEDEIADAIIRLLDMAGGLGIDLFRHINAKLDYNSSRPRLHGKTY